MLAIESSTGDEVRRRVLRGLWHCEDSLKVEVMSPPHMFSIFRLSEAISLGKLDLPKLPGSQSGSVAKEGLAR